MGPHVIWEKNVGATLTFGLSPFMGEESVSSDFYDKAVLSSNPIQGYLEFAHLKIKQKM